MTDFVFKVLLEEIRSFADRCLSRLQLEELPKSESDSSEAIDVTNVRELQQILASQSLRSSTEAQLRHRSDEPTLPAQKTCQQASTLGE